jgi:DNA polymerase-4
MERIHFHVDLDAFYASVEQRDNPRLKGKPVIIGAKPGGRGVVATCSYEARAFGLHSAMPISEAFRRCPHGIYLPVRMRRYSEVSRKIMDILRDFTPDFRQVSIDEAMLDMTGTEQLWGKPPDAAALMKKRIFGSEQLTVTIGIATNPYIAKIASGLRKPDGLTIVERGSETEFMRGLPLDRLWGAGEKTRQILADAGIRTIEELQRCPISALEARIGTAGAAFLSRAARGENPGALSDTRKSSSMSAERTFSQDTADREIIEGTLMLLADELASRLYEDKLSSNTLVLKLRFSDFSSITRQRSTEFAVDSSDMIFCEALRLLDANWDGCAPLRLVGLGFHALKPCTAAQAGLFDEGPTRAEQARRAVQELESKGRGTLVRARFLCRQDSGDDEDTTS